MNNINRIALFSAVVSVFLLAIFAGFALFNAKSIMEDIHKLASEFALEEDEGRDAAKVKINEPESFIKEHASIPSFDSSASSELSELRYVNKRNLGTISEEQIFEIYDLASLEVEADKLILNNNMRLVFEGLFYKLPQEEIVNAQEKLTSAVRSKHGEAVAAEFSITLLEFNDYFSDIKDLDRIRNEQNKGPDEVPDILETKRLLQDSTFGEDKALSLFGVERDALEIMLKQKALSKNRTEPYSKTEIQGMIAEYDALAN